MPAWIAYSHAKINLGLYVLGKLPTGYHQIETGFCFIEWKDHFDVKLSDEYVLNISDKSIPNDENNLISKAYHAFERYVGLKNHYTFNIRKSIPAGAGLGGGSSNAALTLRILNKTEKAGLNEEDLIDISRTLGADVPFFIRGKTGIGRGLGHDIEPLDIQPDSWIVTIYPGFESSTAEAYHYCTPNPEPEFELKEVLVNESSDEWKYLLFNDLEAPVIARNELIGNIKDQLYDLGASYASMTGSGSAIFGIFDQDFVAINAYESFHKLGFLSNLTRPGFKPDRGIYLKED